MTREEFMDIVYGELHSDGDNNRANRIIDAGDLYADEVKPHWIPVTERLPYAEYGESDNVLAACGYRDVDDGDGRDIFGKGVRMDATPRTLQGGDGMNDLISRQAAIDAVRMVIGDNRSISVCDAIKQLPHIQPKRGRWIYCEDTTADCVDGYRCDQCGFFVPWDYQHKGIDFIQDYNLCPHCGAKMEVME